MTFELKQLGPYRIERTEDYEYADDMSCAEMIRVRGSMPKPPVFSVVSHLYKFSETEMALYMNDHKNFWRPLGKLLREKCKDIMKQNDSKPPTKDGEGDNSHTLSARLEDFRGGGDRIDRGKGEANTHAGTVKPGKRPFDSGNGRDPRKEPVLPDDPGDEP